MVRQDTSIERWLHAAVTDAEARGLPELKPLLESLAESTRVLRAAELSGFSPDSPAAPVGAQSTKVSAASPGGNETVRRPGSSGADDR